jgi:hypothetical protein
MTMSKKPICVVDVDEATYLGDGDDGCYYDAAQGPDGKWYASVLVDCETAGFVDTIVSDDGPHDTYEAAMAAGGVWASDWCTDNRVVLSDDWETDEEEADS